MRYFKSSFVAVILSAVCTVVVGSVKEINPTSDSQVVQKLPSAMGIFRKERKDFSGAPDVAAVSAFNFVAQARKTGEARYAGLALGAARAVPVGSRTAEVWLAEAEALQYLHDFDGAKTSALKAVQSRPAYPAAWLLLAAVLRVQGDYTNAARSCENAATLGEPLFGAACKLDIAALQSHDLLIESQFKDLIEKSSARKDAQATARVYFAEWLVRQSRNEEAVIQLQAAKELAPQDGYTAVALATVLNATNKPEQALMVLSALPDTDTVLSHRFAAYSKLKSPQKNALARELSLRLNEARSVPGGASPHWREMAYFKLIEGQYREALALSNQNLKTQKEPEDFWLHYRIADKLGLPAEKAKLKNQLAKIGLKDSRMEGSVK